MATDDAPFLAPDPPPWAARALSALLLAYNVWSLAPLRGLDSAWENAIRRMERESAPDRTVWLMHDFDWAMVYGSLHWGLAEPGTALTVQYVGEHLPAVVVSEPVFDPEGKRLRP